MAGGLLEVADEQPIDGGGGVPLGALADDVASQHAWQAGFLDQVEDHDGGQAVACAQCGRTGLAERAWAGCAGACFSDQQRGLALAIDETQRSEARFGDGQCVVALSEARTEYEEDGSWQACSGCQESVDGQVSQTDYPYSALFGCQPGGGCSSCGGLGVKWDDTDYADMAQSIRAWRLSRGPVSPFDHVDGRRQKVRAAGRLFPHPESGQGVWSYNEFFRECWLPMLRRAGLVDMLPDSKGKNRPVPAFGPHTLRHVAASLWIEQDVKPKKLQEMLGHATLQLTMDLYGHLWTDPAGDDAIAQASERMIVGA